MLFRYVVTEIKGKNGVHGQNTGVYIVKGALNAALHRDLIALNAALHRIWSHFYDF